MDKVIMHMFRWIIGWAIAIGLVLVLLAFVAGAVIQQKTGKPTIVYVTNKVSTVITNQ